MGWKKLFWVALCMVGISTCSIAQPSRVLQHLADAHYTTSQAPLYPTPGKGKVLLSMDYGKSVVLNPQDLSKLDGVLVERIELVYTDFSIVPTFDQTGLNADRVKALDQLAPHLTRDFMIEWNAIALSPLKDRAEAVKQFHGFVITYRLPADASTEAEELKLLSNLLEGSSTTEGYFSAEYPAPLVKREADAIEVSTIEFHPLKAYQDLDLDNLSDVNRALVENILKLPLPKDSTLKDVNESFVIEEGDWVVDGRVQTSFSTTLEIKNGVPAPYAVREWKDRAGTVTSINKVWLLKGGSIETEKAPGQADTVVFSVFHRVDWKNMVVVADITGSMTPYTAQTFLLLKDTAQLQRVQKVVYFNDGDRKDDKRKKVGNTGGIYTVDAKNYDEVHRVGLQAIRGGSGGDLVENDIEAILEAIKACPTCEEVVLIADNRVNPRDVALLSEVSRPIHIIICSMGGCLNVEYLNIAYKTGGSLHFLDGDVEDLSQYVMGDKITIGGVEYVLKTTGKWDYVLPDDY